MRSQTGIYTDTFRFGSSCDSLITTQIQEVDLQLQIAKTIELQRGDSLRLAPSVLASRFLKWQWTPQDKNLDCWNCQNPMLKATKTTVFQLFVRDTVTGCSDKADVNIFVKDCEVFAPTAFSPNNDGQNDYFTVFKQPCANRIKSMQVFGRWGDILFSKENVLRDEDGWDGRFKGREVETGVYIYVVVIELGDGSLKYAKGDVTLIR